MIQFNTELLKRFIAPCIDEVPLTNLPDLGGEFEAAESWMQQYFLSSVFEGEFSSATRPYAESLIARIQMTFASYSSARAKTLDYIENYVVGNPGVRRYLIAVSEWESVFLNLQIIYDLLAKFIDAKYDDGDREDRTRLIANRIKHVSEDIQQGKLTGPSMPLWLTKSGFSTNKCVLTFHEMAEQVRYLAKVADCLSVPSKARERFEALDQAS